MTDADMEKQHRLLLKAYRTVFHQILKIKNDTGDEDMYM